MGKPLANFFDIFRGDPLAHLPEELREKIIADREFLAKVNAGDEVLDAPPIEFIQPDIVADEASVEIVNTPDIEELGL